MTPPTLSRRPAIVTWLAVVVLSIALARLAGVYTLFARHTVYSSLNLSLPIWLLGALDGLWGVIWLIMALGLWLRWSWTRQGILVVFVLSAITQNLLRLLFAQGEYERGQLPFRILSTALLGLLLYYLTTRSHVRQAFDYTTTNPSQHKEPDNS